MDYSSAPFYVKEYLMYLTVVTGKSPKTVYEYYHDDGYEKDYDSFETFAKAMDEYISYYNNERIQAKTKWMPPVKYREASMCA